MPLTVSDASLSTAGVLLLTIVAVEWGGYHMLSLVRGAASRTPFQISFARAGHAHAGVLVILSLVAQLYVDASGMSDPFASLARNGIPLAAILMPAGFFFSSAGAGRRQPSRLIWLLYIGTAALAIGVVTLGVGLLTAS
jgi:hypothetical protein